MEKLVNIAVLVSGSGTNLQALIDAQNKKIIKSGKIKLVVSDKKNAYAIERAKQNNILSVIIEKNKDNKYYFEEKLIKVLEDNKIELIVLAGFLSILSENFVNKYKDRIINIHPSLIPSFCGKGFYGLKVHEMALERGVKITGATCHFVNEIPDGGKIIMQKAVKVLKNDTKEILQKRVMEKAEWKILPLSCEKISKNILKGKNKYV